MSSGFCQLQGVDRGVERKPEGDRCVLMCVYDGASPSSLLAVQKAVRKQITIAGWFVFELSQFRLASTQVHE